MNKYGYLARYLARYREREHERRGSCGKGEKGRKEEWNEGR